MIQHQVTNKLVKIKASWKMDLNLKDLISVRQSHKTFINIEYYHRFIKLIENQKRVNSTIQKILQLVIKW